VYNELKCDAKETLNIQLNPLVNNWKASFAKVYVGILFLKIGLDEAPPALGTQLGNQFFSTFLDIYMTLFYSAEND